MEVSHSRQRNDGRIADAPKKKLKPPIMFVTCRTVQSNNDDEPVGTSIFQARMEKVLGNETSENLRVGMAWRALAYSIDSRNQETENPEKVWLCNVFQGTSQKGCTTDSGREYGSFKQIVERARDNDRPILIYVHGYNNSATSAMATADVLREKHACEVICFLWPSEGRTLDYGIDRADAELSAEPFLRFLHLIKRLRSFHALNDVQKSPAVPISLMCHSMGCYVLKHALVNTDTITSGPLLGGLKALRDKLFDNIILTAADVDSKDHYIWLHQLHPRNKVYVCGSRQDKALKISDAVAGRLFVHNRGNMMWLRKALLLGQDHPPRLGQVIVRDMMPTPKHVYADIVVRWDACYALQSAILLRHSYHMDGQGKIADFYRDAIHGTYREDLYTKNRNGTIRVVGTATN